MARGSNGTSASHHSGPTQGPAAGAPAAPPEWEEIRLADLVRTVYQRRTILATFLLVALLASVVSTVLAQPEFEARASIVPVEQENIITNWLKSRQAAELVVAQMGPAVYPFLAPERWDADAGAWRGPEPAPEVLGARMARQASVRTTTSPGGTGITQVTVTMPDALVARDAAAAYVGTLAHLRPHLDNITRNDMFVKFYDGSNAQEAQRRAEEVAMQKVYWIPLDAPLVPASPARPQPVLNVAIGLLFGAVAGLLAVFAAEGLGRFQAELRGRDELTAPPASRGSAPSGGAGARSFGNGHASPPLVEEVAEPVTSTPRPGDAWASEPVAVEDQPLMPPAPPASAPPPPAASPWAAAPPLEEVAAGPPAASSEAPAAPAPAPEAAPRREPRFTVVRSTEPPRRAGAGGSVTRR